MFSNTRDPVSVRDAFTLPPSLRHTDTSTGTANNASHVAAAAVAGTDADTDAGADAGADAGTCPDDPSPQSDAYSKPSSVPIGTFTTHGIRSTPAGGGKRGAARSMKRAPRSKRTARSVKFIMPSRKKLLSRQQATAHVGCVVHTMHSTNLAKMLVINKLIKLNSTAPVGLMRNIATGVFAP
jgi:hypothetical protein